MGPSVSRVIVLASLTLIAAVTACSVSAEQSPSTVTVEREAAPTATSGANPRISQPTPTQPVSETATIQPTPGLIRPTPAPTTVFVPPLVATPAPSPVSVPQLPTPTVAPANPTERPEQSNPQISSMFGPITCRDGEESVVLTHSIYDPELFDELVPMGRMWDSHVTPTDHLYVFLTQERERDVVRTPAAGRLLSVGSFPREQSPLWDESIKEPDLRVVIAHSCTLFSIFIHVGELTPEITAVVGDLELGGRWFAGPDETIELEAGEAFAALGGSSFDYSLHDETKILTGFQVPEHYEGEPWKVHTVDPFDYMSEELAAELLPKNVRQVEPYGGQIDYDVPGTLAGNWFMDGTVDYRGGGVSSPNYWNGHLSISYDHIDPDQIRISIGRDVGLTFDDCRACGGVYAVKGNTPDPATVTVSDGLIKYEMTGRMRLQAENAKGSVSDGIVLGVFLAEVIDDLTIRMEFVRGASAESIHGFSDNAVLYRR